jgi:hypothetical protein
MGSDLRYDGVSFNGDFIKSFPSEKEMIDHFSESRYVEHNWPGITKTERAKKLKEIYKIVKNAKS